MRTCTFARGPFSSIFCPLLRADGMALCLLAFVCAVELIAARFCPFFVAVCSVVWVLTFRPLMTQACASMDLFCAAHNTAFDEATCSDTLHPTGWPPGSFAAALRPVRR